MRDELESAVPLPHHNGHGGHPLALGLLVGTALGVSLGMLLAPRKGSELRHEVKARANNLAGATSERYRRAREATGDYAHRGHDAYVSAREKIAHGAHDVGRYVRNIAGAVKRSGPETDAEDATDDLKAI